MKFYTGKGDKGETSLMGGRVSKDDPRIEAIGAVDELNAVIGLTLSFQKDNRVVSILKDVQNKLFIVGAELAKFSESVKTPKITENHVKDMERETDSFDIGEIKKFILPSGTQSSVFLHFSRTVARRVERKVVSLSKNGNINNYLLKYLNRLSSLLFALSVYVNIKEGGNEENPTYE